MKDRFTLAMVQMRVDGGRKRQNLDHASDLIRQAAAQGADVVLLPEVMDVGWLNPSCLTEASPIPGGDTVQRLMGAARQNGVYVCAGLAEQAGDLVYNSAVLLDHDGRLLLLHRKINELEAGRRLYAQGDRVNVCDCDLGRVGLMVCADGFVEGQVISRALGHMGADFILSPCAWVENGTDLVQRQQDEHRQLWLDAYQPVARAFSIWIAGLSNVGWVTPDRRGIGSSVCIDPDGREAARGPYGVDQETILYVEIVPVARPTWGTGWKQRWEAPGP